MNDLSYWVEICISAAPELEEILSELLSEETGRGVQLQEALESKGRSQLTAYLPRDRHFRGRIVKIKKRIEQLLAFFPGAEAPVWSLRLIPDQNWQEDWKRFFKPLRVLPRIVICPTWEDCRPLEGDTVLRLDPGQAFGTGGHASTRLCLKAMAGLKEKADPSRESFDRVLDIGTGSGILALVAVCLGAGSVLAVDIDPLAVEAARAHVKLNKMEEKVEVLLGGPEQVEGPFSLILANLTLKDLISIADKIRDLLASGGTLIASGVLNTQTGPLIRELFHRKVLFQYSDSEEEWACLVFVKS